jgi:charged multivesicular body protein 6
VGLTANFSSPQVFGMGNGGAKESSKQNNVVNDHDRAVLDLKNARDTLKQQQKKLTSVMQREKEVARLLLKKGDKKGALWVLKKKKLQESMLEKTLIQLDNVQQMIDSISFAQMNALVFESLQKGRDALKDLNSIMSVEDVENLLQENADQIMLAEQLDEAVRQHTGGAMSKEDEDDIAAEYEKLLELEMLEDGPKLPDAPTHDVKPMSAGEPAKVKKPKEGQLA